MELGNKIFVKKIRFGLLLFALWIVQNIAQAQPYAFYPDSLSSLSWNLRNNTSQIPYPYTGGFKAPILNNMDLNRDGLQDLVVFDRATSRVYCFLSLNINGVFKHQYMPEYEAAFPKMRNWMLLRDYNGDGLLDIFTSEFNRAGIKVFTNAGFNGVNFPEFRLAVPLLQSTLLSGAPAAYYANVTDIPYIGDIDNDGDLDIVNQDFAGLGFELHLNLSMDSLNSRGLNYRKITNCFGGVTATSTCGRYQFFPCLGIPEEEPYAGARRMHAGATINLVNLNDDNNLDIILGDISCTNANALFNSTTRQPIGFRFDSVNLTFPNDANRPHLGTFIHTNLVDINFDNKPDMVFSNNDVATDPRGDANNFYFIPWLSNDRATFPRYTLSANNYLFPDGFDVGSNSRPVSIDWDADGDMDIVMAHQGKLNGSQVAVNLYYINNRVNEGLGLQITDTNFLNIQSLNWVDVRVAFAKLNADSLPDLVVHRRVNNAFITEIYLHRNNSLSPYSFSSPISFGSYNVEPYDSYAFADLTGDGLDDMLVGRSFGRLDYYENNGFSNASTIELSNEVLGFGRINLSNRRPQEMNITLGNLNNDSLNLPDLVVGLTAGECFIYPDVSLAGRNQPFFVDTLINRRSLAFVPTKPFLSVNAYPTIGNFAHDSLPDLLFGGIGGGITVLANMLNSTIVPSAQDKLASKKISLSIYPNPTSQSISIQGLSMPASCTVLDVFGRELAQGTLSPADNLLMLPFPKGLYFLRIGTEVLRIIKQ